MSDSIIRDPYEMKKFAQQLRDYSQSMRREVNVLRTNIVDAGTTLKDDNCKRACANLIVMAEDLLDGLPELEGVADSIDDSAKYLIQAGDIF